MFTVEERDRVRRRLLELAEADPDVEAAAITGSYAVDRSDEWSDVDLAFGIAGDLGEALERWAELVHGELGVVHHWDLPWGSTIYRVFLLAGSLQVDIAFTPIADFGPRGPNWRTIFGETVEVEPTPPRRDDLVGFAWVYVLHAHRCIQRRKPWQAEWAISGIRDQVLALACLRLGLPVRYAKGAEELPAEVTAPLEQALVRSLDETELRRALSAATAALRAELHRTDPDLAARLYPMLTEAARAGG